MVEQEKNNILQNKLINHYAGALHEIFKWICGDDAYTLANDCWTATDEMVDTIKNTVKKNKHTVLPKYIEYRKKHPKCKYCEYSGYWYTPDIPNAPSSHWLKCDLSDEKIKFPNHKKFCKYYTVRKEGE